MEPNITPHAERQSSQEFRHVFTGLAEEVKKDWPFFAFCGFLATAALVWRWHFATVAEALGGHGVLALLVVSFPLRTFVFFVLLFWALGAGAALFHHFGWPWGFLDGVVRHVEGRFLQLTSSLLCVCLGVAAYALLYAALRNFTDGLILLRLVCLVGVSFTSFFLLVSSAYRLLPFFPWPWASGLLVGILLLLGVLLMTDRLFGEAVSRQAPPPAHGEQHTRLQRNESILPIGKPERVCRRSNGWRIALSYNPVATEEMRPRQVASSVIPLPHLAYLSCMRFDNAATRTLNTPP